MKIYPYYVFADYSLFRTDFIMFAARSKRHANRIAKRWVRTHPYASAWIKTLPELKDKLKFYSSNGWGVYHGRNNTIICR